MSAPVHFFPGRDQPGTAASMVTVKLPFEDLGQPCVAPATDGWLVGGSVGCGIVRGTTWTALDVPGQVSALCFDGARTWMAVEHGNGETAGGSIWVYENGSVRRAIDLAALGRAAAQRIRFLTVDAGSAILTSSHAGNAEGLGWAVHRISPDGEITASLETLASSFRMSTYDATVRVGDAIRTWHQGTLSEVVVGLDLVSPRPAIGLRVVAHAVGSAGRHWVALVGRFNEQKDKPVVHLEVRHEREHLYSLELDGPAPNRVSVGESCRRGRSSRCATRAVA